MQRILAPPRQSDPQPSGELRSFGQWVACLSSLVVHCTLCLVLACWLQREPSSKALKLVWGDSASASTAPDVIDLFTSVDQPTESLDTFDALDDPLPEDLPLPEPESIAAENLTLPSLDSVVTDLSHSPAETDIDRWMRSATSDQSLATSSESMPASTSAATMQAKGPNRSVQSVAFQAPRIEREMPQVKRPRLVNEASYYGIRAPGKRFVFVVDASASMMGLRWHSAFSELMECLSTLPEDAEFYVILFSDHTDLLFNQGIRHVEFQPADDEHVMQTRTWIMQRSMGRSTCPQLALSIALRMAPDAIFLLSDGEFRDHSIPWLRQQCSIAQATGQPLPPIHTIALMSDFGFGGLAEIAQNTGGDFRPVTPMNVNAPR